MPECYLSAKCGFCLLSDWKETVKDYYLLTYQNCMELTTKDGCGVMEHNSKQEDFKIITVKDTQPLTTSPLQPTHFAHRSCPLLKRF